MARCKLPWQRVRVRDGAHCSRCDVRRHALYDTSFGLVCRDCCDVELEARALQQVPAVAVGA